jgi:signal transduction histidine kinase
VADNDLASINVTSGVNERGEPFLSVVAVTQGGRFIPGQLDPETVRSMALAWLAAAEAAEQDAAVLRTLRKLELPDELAAAIVHELRQSRSDDG